MWIQHQKQVAQGQRSLRGTVGSIYKGEYYTLVHTLYERSGPYGFGDEDCFYVFPIFSHDAPRAGSVWTPGARLAEIIAGFIKRTTIHCYTQNMKALGFVVSEKKIFKDFPMTPPWRGPYGPQGHGWQDL